MSNWNKYNKVVLKIGSSSLVDPDTTDLKDASIEEIVSDISELILEQKKQIILVLSGALAFSAKYLEIDRASMRLPTRRACSSYGQILLYEFIGNKFAKHGLKIAQILLTLDDFENRKRALNLQSTINTLLSMSIIPVININDALEYAPIKLPDNDQLAARVTQIISGDLLVLLSDIDGLYTSDPRSNSDAEFIPVVETITTEIYNSATGSGSDIGTGGMKSKILAAEMVMNSGIDMIIANAEIRHPLKLTQSNQCPFTLFKGTEQPITARKSWIANLIPKGTIIIDHGAEVALQKGASLLPKGILETNGKFLAGDAVLITNQDHDRIAIGLINFDQKDMPNIIGKHSEEILEQDEYDTFIVVHRDDMILINN